MKLSEVTEVTIRNATLEFTRDDKGFERCLFQPLSQRDMNLLEYLVNVSEKSDMPFVCSEALAALYHILATHCAQNGVQIPPTPQNLFRQLAIDSIEPTWGLEVQKRMRRDQPVLAQKLDTWARQSQAAYDASFAFELLYGIFELLPDP